MPIPSKSHMHQKRNYRNLVHSKRFSTYGVTVQETDLHIHSKTPLISFARESVLRHRRIIETYIKQHPAFMTTLMPWPNNNPVADIIRNMIEAGIKAEVGPMAAVAGAVAESVGKDLLNYSPEIIIENGGDIFLNVNRPVTIGIYGGNSPLSLKMGLKISDCGIPMGVCTSSGTVGHSLSHGRADAVCVISSSCALADAAATSIGNRVSAAKDIEDAIAFGKSINGVSGLIVIIGKEMGLWGNIEVVPLSLKKT